MVTAADAWTLIPKSANPAMHASHFAFISAVLPRSVVAKPAPTLTIVKRARVGIVKPARADGESPRDGLLQPSGRQPATILGTVSVTPAVCSEMGDSGRNRLV